MAVETVDAGSRQRSVFDLRDHGDHPTPFPFPACLSIGPRAAADRETVSAGALPSINYLSFDKIKAEDQRHPSGAGINRSTAAALVSPTTIPSGPPPPYSSSVTANAAPAITGLISPPESRRTSGDEKDPPPPPPHPRQSLPSIFEALGEPPLPYAAQPPPPPLSVNTSHPHLTPHPPSAATFSPTTTTIPRSHPPDAATTHDANVTSSQSQRHRHPPTPSQTNNNPPTPTSHATSFSFPEPRRTTYPATYSPDPHIPSLPGARTDHSSGDSSRPDPHAASPASPTRRPQASPRYEQGPTPTASMTSNSGFGQYQHQYQYPPHSLAGPPSAYQSPSSYGSHVPYPARFDGSEVSRVQEAQQTFKGFKGVNAERYGTSVKRHLEFFDLEASLNEVADSSGRTNQFSRDYIHRVRETKRAGHFPGSLPTLNDIDEVIRQQDRVRDLLARMREMLINQESALAANQVSQEHYHKSAGEYDLEESSLYAEDAKSSGMMGPEAKKRRGRAAPPGRCHSCNRAETPEWRRGPDGARTLCNACGLHYAKLTRKMGSKGAAAGSSLRPKSLGPGSPPPHHH
ncbi:MAG: hypothetical protein M1837_005053 [Sclerophora amabilis]|nr:MAG: hypothetical protein M1837_005053 [Sclerophora amabilis]